MPPTVVITDSTYPDADIERQVLSEIGATVVREDASTPEEVVDVAEGADALLNQETELTAEVFESLDGLQAVARYGVGVDNIDVEAATEHGVKILNVPSYCEDEVSTHALSLLLACVRRVPQYNTHVKRGQWDWKTGRPIPRLRGKTLGFLAFGNIPQQLAEKARGMGMDYVAYDPYRSAEELAEYGVEKVDFDALLDRADALSVHAPLTEETKHLLDSAAFSRMKDDAVVVNVARGPIIDESALVDALSSDELAAAGIDVMETEPPDGSDLFGLDNAILTPHVAWYSEQSIVDLRRSAADAVARVLTDEQPETAVNSV